MLTKKTGPVLAGVWLFFAGLTALGQSGISIPDQSLRQALLGQYDSNGDGSVSPAEAQAATGSLNLSGLGIEDLTGLQHFSGLTQVTAEQNAIGTLPDLSGMTALLSLSLRYNLIGLAAGSVPLPAAIPAQLEVFDLRDNWLQSGYCTELMAIHQGREWTFLISPNGGLGYSAPLECIPQAPAVSPTGTVFEPRPVLSLSSSDTWADHYRVGFQRSDGSYLNSTWQNDPIPVGVTVSPPSDLVSGETYQVKTVAVSVFGTSNIRNAGSLTYVQPDLHVNAPTPSNFTLTPGSSGEISFSFSYHFGFHPDPNGHLAWVWQDTATLQYWDGLTWSATPNYRRVTHWPGATQSSYTVTFQRDTPAQSHPGPWDGADREIRLLFAFQNGGSLLVSDETHLIDWTWSALPAPRGLAPTGAVAQPQVSLSWQPVPGADRYRVRLFQQGQFNPTQFGAGTVVTEPAFQTTLPAGIPRDVWIAAGNGSDFGPPANLGTIGFTPPSFSHGTASPATVTVDFFDNKEHTLVFPFSYQNLLEPLLAEHLRWSWEAVIDGQTYRLTGNHQVGLSWRNIADLGADPGWYPVTDFFPITQVFEDRIVVRPTQQDFPDGFWLTAPGNLFTYGDRQVTVRLRYRDPQLPAIDFAGTPPQMDFQRGGALPPPPTPPLLAPQAPTTDFTPAFSWQPVPGVRRYNLYAEGMFQGDQVTVKSNLQFGAVIEAPSYTFPINFQTGRTYEVRIEAETPTGRSPVQDMGSITVTAPLTMEGLSVVIADHVVEGCGQPVELSVPIAQIADDFDPAKLRLFLFTSLPLSSIPPEQRKRFWDGTAWQQNKVALTLVEPETDGFRIVGNTLVGRWDSVHFTPDFWARTLPDTSVAIDYQQIMPLALYAEYHHGDSSNFKDRIKDSDGLPWTQSLELTRWKTPDPPAALQDDSCYRTDPEPPSPELAWDAISFADHYYLGIQEVPDGWFDVPGFPTLLTFEEGALVFINRDGPIGNFDEPLASPQSAMPFPMEAGKVYNIWLASGFEACRSPFQLVLRNLEWYPPVTAHSALFLDPPAGQVFHWETRNRGARVFPKEYPFHLQVTDPPATGPIGYHPRCDQVAYRKELELYINEPYGSNGYRGIGRAATKVTAEDSLDENPYGYYVRLLDYHTENFIEPQLVAEFGADWYGAVNGHPENQIFLDSAITLVDQSGTPIRYFATTLEKVAVQFEPDPQQFLSFSLGEPEPDTHILEPEPDPGNPPPPEYERVAFTLDFDYVVTRPEAPIFPAWDRFRWIMVDPETDTHWNGTAWTPNPETFFPFATNLLDPKTTVYDGAVLDFNEQRIEADIPATLFAGNFFGGAHEKHVGLRLVYVAATGEVIATSGLAMLHLYRPLDVAITEMTVGDPNPNPIYLVPEQTESTASFVLPFSYELEAPQSPPGGLENYPFVPNVEKFLMLWKDLTDPANPRFWNGAAWVTAPERTNLGTHASSPFFSHILLNWAASRAEGAIPAPLFGDFFGEDDQKQLVWEWIYTGNAAEIVSETGSVIFTRLEPDNTLIWDDPFTFLADLPDQGPVLAPEPFPLQEGSEYYLLGKNLQSTGIWNFPQDPTPLPLETDLAWLRIESDPAEPVDLLAFLCLFPGHNSALESAYAARVSTHLDLTGDLTAMTEAWQGAGNLAYRYFPNANGNRDRLVLVVYAPDRVFPPEPPAWPALAESHHAQFGGTAAFLATLRGVVDPQHNRQLDVAYLDESGERALFTVSFGDLLGRAQETHAVGSHVDPDAGMPQGWMVHGGVTRYDPFGRVSRSVKGFPTAMGGDPATALTTAGTRTASFSQAQSFWNQPGVPYLVGDPEPYAETLYEPDSRGRETALLPLGAVGHDLGAGHYTRIHYFAATPPTFQGFHPELHNLPRDPQGAPALLGRLTVDADGDVSVSFTGSDPETELIAVANPSSQLIAVWGLTPTAAAPTLPEDLNNETVVLPSDYDSRLNTLNGGRSKNLVTVHHIDRYGRTLASYPPRCLALTDDWRIVHDPAETGLATTYDYDRFDRLVTRTEPDAGITRYRTNTAGQVRLTQHANQAADPQGARWTETVYDDLGRVVLTREIRLDAPTSTQLEATQINAPVLEETVVATHYDRKPNTTLPPVWACRWPSETALLNHYPFPQEYRPAGFGNPLGQIAEIRAYTSAERFYHDTKGRIVCKVVAFKDLVEPQVYWSAYDRNDLPVATYHLNSGVGARYTHDSWNRIVAIEDLNPSPVRWRLEEAHATATGSEHGLVHHAVGPLTGAGGTQQQPYPLASRSHTATGHVDRVRFGPTGALHNAWVYDVRDWPLTMTATYDTTPLYSSEHAYFGHEGRLAPATPRFDGSIAAIRESYGNHLGLEARTLTHQYGYGPSGQLIRAATRWQNLEALDLTTENRYGYDANGNRVEEIRDRVMENGSFTTGVHQFLHHLDTGSNRLLSVHRDGNPHIELAAANGQGHYDAMGNLTELEKVDGAGNRIRQNFHYEDARFPTLPTRIEQTATLPGGGPNHALTLSLAFRYDHNGARIKRVCHEYSAVGQSLPSEVTWFLPAGTENQACLDGRGRFKRVYLFAGEERIGFKDGRDTAVYLKNHLGSTKMTVGLHQAEIDDAILLAYSDTDAYGVTWRELANAGEGFAADPEPHGFTGQEKEPDLGLYYYGARYYMPDLGRFLQVDPAREFWNPYSYVRNSPIIAVDQNGEETLFVHGTWSDPTTFDPSFKKAVLSSLNDVEGPIFRWTGGNNRVARSEAATALFKEVYKLHRQGKPINIVGHSHGGNVAAELSKLVLIWNYLNGDNIRINNLIQISTPIRDDYNPSMEVIENYNLISSTIDNVQINGGYDKLTADVAALVTVMFKGGEAGGAERTHGDANNILIDRSTLKTFGIGHWDIIRGHGLGKKNIELWNKVIDPQLDK